MHVPEQVRRSPRPAVAGKLRRAGGWLLLAGPLLLSCSGGLVVKPRGTVTSGVLFEFWRGDDPEHPSKVWLSDLEVEQLGADGRWKPCWRVQGSARLSEVRYGETPRGMTRVGDLVWLQYGARYRIRVAASDTIAARYGGADFEIGPDGAPRGVESS